MRENTIQTIWAAGGTVINGWLHIPSTWTAEVMAHQGWDSLTIDMQHGVADLNAAFQMMQAISTTATIPLVRVPWNEPGVIMRSLDLGAYGIICPMINTRAQCEAFVGACRYHPQGYRSLGPVRARIYGGPDYAERANDTILTIAMIETGEAMDNLDGILSVPGLDAIYIGPSDLGLSLFGSARADSEDPAFLEAIDTIMNAARRHNVKIGMHTASVAYARKMIARGAQFVTVLSDTALMSDTAKMVVNQMKDAAAPTAKRTDAY